MNLLSLYPRLPCEVRPPQKLFEAQLSIFLFIKELECVFNCLLCVPCRAKITCWYFSFRSFKVNLVYTPIQLLQHLSQFFRVDKPFLFCVDFIKGFLENINFRLAKRQSSKSDTGNKNLISIETRYWKSYGSWETYTYMTLVGYIYIYRICLCLKTLVHAMPAWRGKTKSVWDRKFVLRIPCSSSES